MVLYTSIWFYHLIMQVELLKTESTNDSELKLVTFVGMVSKTQVAKLYAAEKNSLIDLELVDGNSSSS